MRKINKKYLDLCQKSENAFEAGREYKCVMFSVKPGSRNEKQVDTHTSHADTQRTSAKFEKYVTITDHSTLSSYSVALFLFIRFGKKLMWGR